MATSAATSTDATNANSLACYPGDSGGPVYQRTSKNNVYAAGLIIGAEKGNNHHCYYLRD